MGKYYIAGVARGGAILKLDKKLFRQSTASALAVGLWLLPVVSMAGPEIDKIPKHLESPVRLTHAQAVQWADTIGIFFHSANPDRAATSEVIFGLAGLNLRDTDVRSTLIPLTQQIQSIVERQQSAEGVGVPMTAEHSAVLEKLQEIADNLTRGTSMVTDPSYSLGVELGGRSKWSRGLYHTRMLFDRIQDPPAIGAPKTMAEAFVKPLHMFMFIMTDPIRQLVYAVQGLRLRFRRRH